MPSAVRYQEGTELLIQPHNPPPPWGRNYYRHGEEEIRKPVRPSQIDEETGRVDFTLSHPPIETSPPNETKPRRLTIIGEARGPGTNENGAQVLLCYLDSDKTRRYIAKIYDGVKYDSKYYSYADFMYHSDRDYTYEANAYQNIPSSLQGSIVPQYFGSWTFSVDEGENRLRWVRLILLSYVDGTSMDDVIHRAQSPGWAIRQERVSSYHRRKDVVNYKMLPPEEERLDIFASVLEAEVNLFHTGVLQSDLHPSDVLILPACDGSPSSSRVILVDFVRSTVLKYRPWAQKSLEARRNSLPVNPAERLWRNDFGPFYKWLPQSWLNDKEKAREWMYKRFAGSSKYKEISRKFLYHKRCDPVIKRLVGESGEKRTKVRKRRRF
jgi:hypothetical protein